MILQIKQTKGNFKNRFEIRENGHLKYAAGTPWMDIDLPFHGERVRRCVLTDAENRVLLLTQYDILENVAHTAIPMKWVFTGEQKSLLFDITDQEGRGQGRFYQLTEGLWDRKFVLEWGRRSLRCYDVSAGTTRNLLFFDGRRQIAQAVKPLHVEDNLDTYILFLLEEYRQWEAFLSFFTVFFDDRYYANRGEAVAEKKEISRRYSYDKNRKYYDKNWISKHFDDEGASDIFRQIEAKRKQMTSEMKKRAKRTLLMIAGIWGAAAVVVLGLYFFVIRG